MSDFTLGPIKVIDNGDGVYSEPVKGAKTPQDEIVDGSGKSVTPTGAEAQAALKALGVSSLKGLKLSPASTYLDAMNQAQSYAAAGDTPQALRQLRRARTAAGEAKLPFAETRATGILEKALTKELDGVVARATTAAANGDVIAMQDALSAGRELLGRLNVPLDQAKAKGLALTPDVITQLETQGYGKALPGKWKEAEAASQNGEVARYQSFRDQVRGYAARAGQTLTSTEETKLADLELAAHQNSVNLHLADAATAAQLGDVESTRFHLRAADDAALLGKKKLSPGQRLKRQNAEREALKRAPDFLFAKADLKAAAGDFEAARALIQQAKDYRAQLGRGLSAAETKRAEAIEKKALQLSIDVLLKKASTQVDQVKKDGSLTKVKAFIDQARDNATLIGSALSAAQETSVTQTLTQAHEAAVEWRFKQAEHSADLGKVDDTVVPLNAGRELAKQGKVKFDEARADKAMNTALVNGIELEFQIAEKIAPTGDREATLRHLDLARENARRAKQKFDEKRAEGIVALLP